MSRDVQGDGGGEADHRDDADDPAGASALAAGGHASDRDDHAGHRDDSEYHRQRA